MTARNVSDRTGSNPLLLVSPRHMRDFAPTPNQKKEKCYLCPGTMITHASNMNSPVG
jgi:hypothetical protein